MDKEYMKKLVVARLKTIPPNIGFCVGSHGNFTRNEVIREVLNETEVGKEFSEMEIKLLIEMPRIIGRLSAKASSSY